MFAFQVTGMRCGHCIKAVTNAIHGVDADATVEIDLATQSVRVESQSRLDTLSAAIADAGYAVVGAAVH